MITDSLNGIRHRLMAAFDRHGFDVRHPNFQVELRALLGSKESVTALEFLTEAKDIPLSLLLSLCAAIDVPASEIVGTDDGETLQIYDYLGSNPAFIKLPMGLAWNRDLISQRLFYTPAPADSCGDINENDFLILTRECSFRGLGEIFMIETDQKLMLRKYSGMDPSGQNRVFTNDSHEEVDELLLPLGAQTLLTSNGHVAALTGKVQFNLQSAST